MKSISLKLPEALDAQLEAMAKKRSTKKSIIVRRAIADYLSRGQQPPRSSFLEQARDLAGCLEAAVDLSTNKKYLRGYGR